MERSGLATDERKIDGSEVDEQDQPKRIEQDQPKRIEQDYDWDISASFLLFDAKDEKLWMVYPNRPKNGEGTTHLYLAETKTYVCYLEQTMVYKI